MKRTFKTVMAMFVAAVILLPSCEHNANQENAPAPVVIQNAVEDIDGNVYDAVQIGNQVWMLQNLRTTHYANGDDISIGNAPSIDEAGRYYPNYDSNNVKIFGYLYNWPAVMHGSSSSNASPSGVQGICPDGWHVPSDTEWTQLTDYVSSKDYYVYGSNNTYIAKALASISAWKRASDEGRPGKNPNANNATGFSALPAGHYSEIPPDHYGCINFGEDALFWSATEQSEGSAYYRGIYYDYPSVKSGYYDKFSGYSVRCVRD
ncbi:MAG: fibrobacter succinogenes major paralogous domain-containing protein [Bacteroidales bacterium]|nr:fibrobacter succinogenes major paralogous domain-containing protein [Bacteroidales bacterium]